MWATVVDCSAGCLFNLTADITEHNDLAAEQPELVATMGARIREINATAFSPQRGAPSPLGCQVALRQNGGFWGPFVTPGPPPPPPPSPSPPYVHAPITTLTFPTVQQTANCKSKWRNIWVRDVFGSQPNHASNPDSEIKKRNPHGVYDCVIKKRNPHGMCDCVSLQGKLGLYI